MVKENIVTKLAHQVYRTVPSCGTYKSFEDAENDNNKQMKCSELSSRRKEEQ